MKVNIQIKRAAKFLDKGDRACLTVFDAGDAPAVALPCEDALEVAAEHGRQEAGIAREVDAKLVRQRQHELTIGCQWKNSIHQVLRGVPNVSKTEFPLRVPCQHCRCDHQREVHLPLSLPLSQK